MKVKWRRTKSNRKSWCLMRSPAPIRHLDAKAQAHEQGFGWAKFIIPPGDGARHDVDQVFMMAVAAYSLVRMRTGTSPS